MSATEPGTGLIDLSRFELEYAELTAISYRPDIGEIELTMQSPVVNWYWKRKREKLKNSLGFCTPGPDSAIHFKLSLRFSGVSDIEETLLSRGHTVGNESPDTDWMKTIIFDVEEIQNVRVDSERLRFRLIAEGLTLEFNYRNFWLRLEPISLNDKWTDARIRRRT